MMKPSLFTFTKLLVALLLVSPFASDALAQQSGQTTTGPFVRMVRHNDGSRTVTAKSQYDPNSAIGKTQSISTYDPEGVLRLKRVYQLNKYSKPETFIIYDGNNRPLVEGVFTYDFQDRIQEEVLYLLPSKQMLRKQVHNYSGGSQGTVNTTNYAAMPTELLRWMDPDGYVAGIKSKDENQPNRGVWHRGNGARVEEENEENDGGGGLFSRFRNRNK